MLIAILWIILAAGIYRHNVSTGEKHESKEPWEAKNDQEGKGVYEGEDDAQPKQEQTARKKPGLPDAFSEYIRVLIKTDDFSGIYHDGINIICESGFTVEFPKSAKEYGAGEEFKVNRETFKYEGIVKITGKDNGKLVITNLKRGTQPSYRGSLECYYANEGIVLINELKVEEYLYGVVPSEMPSLYPAEALKAQAISARTYAYFHKKSYAYPEWRANLDDSTSFQVYNNISETPETVNAVNETNGEVLAYGGEVIESFYYSTSGGYSGGACVWGESGDDEYAYLRETGDELFASNNAEGEAAYKRFIDSGNPEDVEFGEAWYRWTYDKSFEGEKCRQFLSRLYELSIKQPQNVRVRSRYLPKEKLSGEAAVKDIRVLARQKSGLVAKLIITTENFAVSITTQSAIRQALCIPGDIAKKNDGASYSMGEILPSAYFYIEKNADGDNLNGITIHAAGLGHGCGMSQNGAKCLAYKGFTAYGILAYYYNGDIVKIGDVSRFGGGA